MKPMINRRSFLKITAGAAALAALGPDAYCAAPKRNLRKAIMYSTIGVKGSVLEKFRAMKEAGFEGVEPMGGMDREEVIAAFKETGLAAASVCCHTHWEKPLSAADEATRTIGLDGLVEQRLTAANVTRLGAGAEAPAGDVPGIVAKLGA